MKEWLIYWGFFSGLYAITVMELKLYNEDPVFFIMMSMPFISGTLLTIDLYFKHMKTQKEENK